MFYYTNAKTQQSDNWPAGRSALAAQPLASRRAAHSPGCRRHVPPGPGAGPAHRRPEAGRGRGGGVTGAWRGRGLPVPAQPGRSHAPPAVARAPLPRRRPLPAASARPPRPSSGRSPAGPSGEMNTVLSRANSLFAFSLSVMAALTFGCFITTAFKERSVPVRIAVSRVTLKNVEDFTGPRERSDLGFVTFDITADLQSIFDWNVKQLFLYLSAEYSTKNNALNQVVLWDKIMLRGDNPRLSLKDMKSKYFFFDDGNGLKGNRNITLTLSWNVVPNAGILPLVTGSGHVTLPMNIVPAY
uniref:Signal peptidase complex subunit 3 n=1 Tax=Corvus moneduloides TaxID=1196302 RepID=A0A8C3DRT4_CORMO